MGHGFQFADHVPSRGLARLAEDGKTCNCTGASGSTGSGAQFGLGRFDGNSPGQESPLSFCFKLFEECSTHFSYWPVSSLSYFSRSIQPVSSAYPLGIKYGKVFSGFSIEMGAFLGDFPLELFWLPEGKSNKPPAPWSRRHAPCGTCSESGTVAGGYARAKLRGVKMWAWYLNMG